ncbi:caspase domain-containing protein [Streptomyces sp. NPDC060286]|uniref:caspase family protein n=1 Tax=unclassified Streptomyces TaxID=2593676 RepID=UPI0035D6028B
MPEPERACRALVIGNSDFPGDPQELPRLNGPTNDVWALRRALTDPLTGLHLPGAVKVLVDEVSQRVNEELVEFFEHSFADEQLLLYYSGHGRLDLHNRLRLCTRDTTLDGLRIRSVRHEFINELIDECAARSIVVVLDCCFSGVATVKGADPATQLSGRGRFVMTSSSHAGLSSDAANTLDPSPFTRHLVDGLRSGASGRDGYATVHDVYAYVHDQMRTSGQTPHMKAEGGVGQVPLARRPTRPDEGSTGKGGAFVPVGAAEALDIRPVFVDARGNRTLLPTESDFTGVLHVLLPRRRTVLTTHRDDIAGAPGGSGITAELRSRARVRPHDLRARVTGGKPSDVRGGAVGGAVRFTLPEGAGSVTWTERQVREFGRAKAIGYWPSTSRPANPHPGWQGAGAEDEPEPEDLGHASLVSAKRSALSWLVLGPVAAGLYMAQSSLYAHAEKSQLSTATELVAVVVLCLLGATTLFSLLTIVTGIKILARFRNVERLRRDHTLPVTPMFMAHIVASVDKPGFEGAVPVDVPLAWLWHEGAFVTAMRARDERGASTLDHPDLVVPVLYHYRREFAARRKVPTPERVEVIGNPERGQWLAIRTERGVIWPREKAM